MEFMKALQEQFLGMLESHSIISEEEYIDNNIFIINTYNNIGQVIGKIICSKNRKFNISYTLYLTKEDKSINVNAFELYKIIDKIIDIKFEQCEL